MDALFTLTPVDPTSLGEISATLYHVWEQGDFLEPEAGIVQVPASMPFVKGIYIGGCIENGTGRISNRTRCELAHAHTGGPYVDWICYQLPKYFYAPEYEWLRQHEHAHVISGRGHDERWRKIMRMLGQVIPPRYAYRPRKAGKEG